MARVERRPARSRQPTWWPGGLVGLLLVPHSAVGMLVAIMVGPAIWSRKQFRRDAALAVLERFSANVKSRRLPITPHQHCNRGRYWAAVRQIR